MKSATDTLSRPPRCRWLPTDRARTNGAELVRLIIDDKLWHQHHPIDATQGDVLKKIVNILPENVRMLICPAGLFTAAIEYPQVNFSALEASLAKLDATLSPLINSELAASGVQVLVGVDGCDPATSTPLQTLVFGSRQLHISRASAVVKLYPESSEDRHLLGWRIVQAAKSVPLYLQNPREFDTVAGTVLPLVCHESILFSGRSKANLNDAAKQAVREFLFAKLRLAPTYTVMATHWLTSAGKGSGGSFLNARNEIASQGRTTVVVACFAPGGDLEAVARRFEVVGPRRNRVATLLLEAAKSSVFVD